MWLRIRYRQLVTPWWPLFDISAGLGIHAGRLSVMAGRSDGLTHPGSAEKSRRWVILGLLGSLGWVAVVMLIAVWGAAPGIGKSTLCAGLARWLAGAGCRVDLFAEEQILTRAQFAEVAARFRATGEVEPAELLAATSRYARSVAAGGVEVVVADALVPFVPSLLAMGYGQEMITGFTAALTTALRPAAPVLVYLDGDIGAALTRAEAREGPGWLRWYVGKLARYGLIPAGSGLAAAATYLEHERAVTLSAARQAGWPVIMIARATELVAADILQAATGRLSHTAGTGLYVGRQPDN